MRGCRNCARRHTEYCIGPDSGKCVECIRLGSSYNLAVKVKDLDKINTQIVQV